MGLRFIEIETSPVPQFAWEAYRKNINDDVVRYQIVDLVGKYLVASETERATVDGLILVGDGNEFDLMTESLLAQSNHSWKFVIPLGDFSSATYLRCHTNTSNKHFMVSHHILILHNIVSFLYLFLQVEAIMEFMDNDGNLMSCPTNFIVDTSFPGICCSDRKSFKTEMSSQ